MSENIDVPVSKCEQCGADVWKSMITGNLIKSCNCKKIKVKPDGKGKVTK